MKAATNKYRHFLGYAPFIGLMLLYLLITFLPSPDPAAQHKYHLTTTAMRILDLSIVVPALIIWFAAFYGYYSLSQYSELVKTSDEGKQINNISYGLMVLAYSLPLTAIISAAIGLLARHNHMATSSSTIITNYIGLLFPLVAFSIISHGTNGLTEICKNRPSYRAIYLFAMAFILLSVAYCSLVLTNNYLGPHSAANSAYHLPIWLTLLTLVCPYLYMWFIGLWSGFQLYLYNATLKGSLYRRAWLYVWLGIDAIVLTSILLQFLTTAAPAISGWSLQPILALIYPLLILISVGYIFVATGAKRLQRIEEV